MADEDCSTPETISTFGELHYSGDLDITLASTFGFLCEGETIIPELLPFVPQFKYKDDAYYLMMNKLLPRGYLWTGLLDILNDIITNIVIGLDPDPAPGDPPVYPVTEETNLFKRLLSCFASELTRVEKNTMELVKESVPGLSTQSGLLTDWERVAGLPDDCTIEFASSFSIQDRQRQVHAKLIDEFQTVTAQYLEDYAETLGWDITVTEQQVDALSMIMGVGVMGVGVMGGVTSYAEVIITVNDGPVDTSLLKCIFNRIKPAHVELIWVE